MHSVPMLAGKTSDGDKTKKVGMHARDRLANVHDPGFGNSGSEVVTDESMT